MARWEFAASNGFLRACTNEGAAYIVASNVIRFRREVRPLQTFEVHTTLTHADEKQMWMTQIMRSPSHESGKGGHVHAGSIVRAVLRKGRDTVSPLKVAAAIGVDPATVDSAPSSELAALATLEKALSSQ